MLNLPDANGISVRKAIEDFGLNPAEITPRVYPTTFAGYLEFHIEQGPVLETLHLPLAAVEAIAGQSRLEIVFVGRANHAGTTPMDLRFDAVTAAAEWITTVENAAKAIPALVATVGSVQTKPGATNVIASETRLTLDVRHRDNLVRSQAVEDMVRNAKEIAQRRGLSVRPQQLMNQPAVPMDPSLVTQIEVAIAKTGCQPHRMVSGAGHDAMILAEKIPSAMIFLRSPDGISHDPAESVSVDDVALAIECGLHLLEQLASAPTFQTRTLRA